ncbi:MAG: hypothetical protein K5829_11650 [Treponema sp.]|nr:hypothetical protein [Treponema sp.]
MGKKNSNLFFLYLFPFILISFALYNFIEYAVCYKSIYNLPEVRNEELMRIKIYGSSDNGMGSTVSATFSIIDSNGNEIAVIERSWSGSYLSVEFSQIAMAGKKFLFPARIFGNNQILSSRNKYRKVTSLEKYYNDNSQCMLLGSGSSYEDRKYLYRISRLATKDLPVIDFGYKNIYTVDLSACKTGVYYSIFQDSFGNLVLEQL